MWQFNEQAGEEYLIIKENDYNNILNKYKLYGDFWIFDKKRIMKLFYDQNNDFTHNEITTKNTKKYIDFYNELLTKTIPLKEVLIKFRKNIKEII